MLSILQGSVVMAALPQEALWLLVVIGSILLVGITLLVASILTGPRQHRVAPPPAARPGARFLLPGRAFRDNWQQMKRQERGLHGPTLTSADPFRPDAFLLAPSPTSAPGTAPLAGGASTTVSTVAPSALGGNGSAEQLSSTRGHTLSAFLQPHEPVTFLPSSPSPIPAPSFSDEEPPDDAPLATPTDTGTASLPTEILFRPSPVVPSRFGLEAGSPSGAEPGVPSPEESWTRGNASLGEAVPPPARLRILPSRFGLEEAEFAPPSSPEEAPEASSADSSFSSVAVPPSAINTPSAEAAVSEAGSEPHPLSNTPMPDSGLTPEAPGRLLIRGFGEAYLSLDGANLPMRKATQELALALLLAHRAAEAQAARRDLPWTQRTVLADLLWPRAEEEELQRQSLNQCKLNLSKRLRAAGLDEDRWLESRASPAALRLHPHVRSDLVEFLALAQQIEQARAAGKTGPASQPAAAEVQAWLGEIQTLYQGGFATQFVLEDWAADARRRYRRVYYDALFDAAQLLAASGERRKAIAEAKGLLLQEEAPADEVLPTLLGWLKEEGGLSEIERWQSEYRRSYAHKFGRELEQDRPHQNQLLRQALAQP